MSRGNEGTGRSSVAREEGWACQFGFYEWVLILHYRSSVSPALSMKPADQCRGSTRISATAASQPSLNHCFDPLKRRYCCQWKKADLNSRKLAENRSEFGKEETETREERRESDFSVPQFLKTFKTILSKSIKVFFVTFSISGLLFVESVIPENHTD
jgi:hypothetical protein